MLVWFRPSTPRFWSAPYPRTSSAAIPTEMAKSSRGGCRPEVFPQQTMVPSDGDARVSDPGSDCFEGALGRVSCLRCRIPAGRRSGRKRIPQDGRSRLRPRVNSPPEARTGAQLLPQQVTVRSAPIAQGVAGPGCYGGERSRPGLGLTVAVSPHNLSSHLRRSRRSGGPAVGGGEHSCGGWPLRSGFLPSR